MIFNINSTRGQTRFLTCVARVTCLLVYVIYNILHMSSLWQDIPQKCQCVYRTNYVSNDTKSEKVCPTLSVCPKDVVANAVIAVLPIAVMVPLCHKAAPVPVVSHITRRPLGCQGVPNAEGVFRVDDVFRRDIKRHHDGIPERSRVDPLSLRFLPLPEQHVRIAVYGEEDGIVDAPRRQHISVDKHVYVADDGLQTSAHSHVVVIAQRHRDLQHRRHSNRRIESPSQTRLPGICRSERVIANTVSVRRIAVAAEIVSLPNNGRRQRAGVGREIEVRDGYWAVDRLEFAFNVAKEYAVPRKVELGAVRVNDVVWVEVTQCVPFARRLGQLQLLYCFLELCKFRGRQVSDLLANSQGGTPGSHK